MVQQDGSKWLERKITNANLNNYDKKEFYEQQANAINNGIKNFEQFINNAIANNKTIAGYGAGGRGVMTLAALKNGNQLLYLVDKKPKAKGVYSPSSHLPVVEIDELKNKPVDIVIVFSFGYMTEIKQDLKQMGYTDEQIISMVDILK